jgi:hypothetical protein
MKKTENPGKKTKGGGGVKLFDDEKIENMLPSMQKAGAFFRAEGFTLIEAGKTTGAYGCPVNRCHFVRKQENIFIIINKLKRTRVTK